MNRLASLLAVAAMCCGALSACTPRPNDAEPTAASFVEAIAGQDYEALSELVDDPTTATDSISSTWDGLQAQGADITLREVTQQDNVATATYTVDWVLPRQRSFAYDAQMTLTQTGGEWTVRWQPSVLHPRLGAHQHLELRAVEAQQASVVSSDGAQLLTPGVAYRVLVDTSAMASAREAASRISTTLAEAHRADESVPTRDAAQLESELSAASGTYSAAVVPKAAQPIVAGALGDVAGVRLNEEAAMVNADPTFAPDIMARVGELVRDDLEGTAGWNISIVNQHGAALEEIAGQEPEPAPAVEVSLDHTVQRAAEKALEPLAGQQAMIVAIRPSTGGVLAVAQTPAADRDGNIATMGQYPPGSTFKIITAAAGLENQGLTPASTVPCPGTMNIYGRVVTNYAGFSLGNAPLEQAFARSCNTTFADISTKLEPGRLAEVGKQFGLGLDMEIPGLDTITGSIPVGEEPLDRTEAGYGQGRDLASPFGMALVAATAARGSMPVPYLVDGETTQATPTEAPAPETIAQLQQMMSAVTSPGGTAAGMSAAGDIRGKTGEAEINQGSHAWFTGYRADDDIAFATLIVLGGGSQAAVAATDRMLVNIDQARAGGGQV
ncbi:penicillin-binding transpeptidase domain-containing protein [Corynebacterium sanguinis]|uniref:penicillin-binding transpeptidase domain-containing protein n=1 Tax=Corynebacterium sanguinis TaxID=2594913 RepID=UPI0011A3EE13|nr:penicillin-binding transpeptidase domain-containing protein [Corynebacterium sanguinis]MCT1413097.1 penicillin-binding transpeptidase domain-containing protein [Corynebacterium sanguinis]MCT1613842.1 penicillin-binding transpeptidase domain-containing protein [Corynebacterium sanguinis]TVS26833.1 penicillin-binding transpeptidase domain-containing protein [Corynebacterium sanguinis]